MIRITRKQSALFAIFKVGKPIPDNNVKNFYPQIKVGMENVDDICVDKGGSNFTFLRKCAVIWLNFQNCSVLRKVTYTYLYKC